MSDAFECDRCGELSGSPPEARLATNAAEEAGGTVSLKEKHPDRSATVGTLSAPQQFRSTTYEINQGDLCEPCAESFREFWGDPDE